MLGLSVQSDDATAQPGRSTCATSEVLLILDTCEHLIEAVATLAVAHPRRAHPASTSWRRAARLFRWQGEHVYRLEPLACPPDDSAITAAVAQRFPATRLFVERAAASGARLDFGDAEAAIVVGICRKLDGVALAIELAARRVEAYGLQQTAALLDQRLTLLWLGLRTAPPRQKTLQATLDWSYGLLSEVERVVLRRLADLRRAFHARCGAGRRDRARRSIKRSSLVAIDSLVAKSMVATRPIGAMMRYRLLDTTRAYALELSVDDAEFADLAARHAAYYRRWLEQTGAEWPTLSSRDGTGTLLRRSQQCPRGSGMVLRPQRQCRGSGSGLPLLPRRCSGRCRCCPNVIAGRSGRFSLSTMPTAAGPRRCIFRRASACP